MKSLKYIFMGFAALALATSCSKDQLETSPTTAVSGTTMTESNDAANKCGNISITGGTVTATGGLTAAGIGTGAAVIGYENRFASTICGDILITGGTVTANGDVGAAGIGTGSVTTIMGTGSSKCGNITIDNGVTKVTATKVSDSACSIGKAGDTHYECGTITIGGTVYDDGISISPYTYPEP
jgi:hypothetical protein